MIITFIFLFCIASASEVNFTEHVHIKENEENKIGYLKIEREHSIDQSTFLYIKFALEHFKKEKVCCIVLDMDTPGGEVFAATKIAQQLIKIDSEEKIPVVAFIDNWALSAGAMIAYSCRYIGITPTASMGAAEPILVDSQGNVQKASEKITSAFRAEIINLSSMYGRNPLLAEAMVDRDIILVIREGSIIKLQSADQIFPSDQVIIAEGKLLTLNAKQLLEWNIADFEAGSIWNIPFFSHIPNKKIIPYEDWKINFFAFLSHPAISSLLFLGLLIGVYLEVSHPGFGLPGVLAICCLALILLSSFAVQAIHWLELIILGLGLLFLLIEIFIIPGFGIVGILGILMTLGGLFALMLPGFEGIDLSSSWGWNLGIDILLDHLAWFCGAFLVALAVIAYLMRTLPKRRFVLKRLILEEDQEGYAVTACDSSYIGKMAIADTDLKPSGHIVIEDKSFQAISQSGYLSKGASVKIIDVRGSYFIVKNFEKELPERSEQ